MVRFTLCHGYSQAVSIARANVHTHTHTHHGDRMTSTVSSNKIYPKSTRQVGVVRNQLHVVCQWRLIIAQLGKYLREILRLMNRGC